MLSTGAGVGFLPRRQSLFKSFTVDILLNREYLMNIKVVDAGIQKVVELIEKFYDNDGKTAYVMSADHGMTNWGPVSYTHLTLPTNAEV